MTVYYNEIEPYAAQWLRNLIAAGLIPSGDVDERSIVDISAGDLAGYRQCHFFAGLGGWPRALRLAGWPDGRRVWTGSCPCQPFSLAGRQSGTNDERHLWPAWFALIMERRPPVIFGEQVAAAVGKGWLDETFDDLESQDYACASAVLPACSVGAPHRRDRLWFVAHTHGREPSSGRGNDGQVRGIQEAQRQSEHGAALPGRSSSAVANADSILGNEWRLGDASQSEGRRHADRGSVGSDVRDTDSERLAIGQGERCDACEEQPATVGADWWTVEPDVGRVADGVPARVGKLRALGNAIVPQVAAEFIAAARDVIGSR